MRLPAALFGSMALFFAAPAMAFGPYPHEDWAFTLQFKRLPMAPTCHEKYGKGTLKRTRGGRNPTYVLTGFPQASIITCTFPNGGRFDVNAAWYFDLPEDGFWGKGTVERMKPGDIGAVRAVYTYKGGGLFVEGTYFFETYKGRIKQAGGSKSMYRALVHGEKE